MRSTGGSRRTRRRSLRSSVLGDSVAIALPLLAVLSKSVLDTEGRFIGLANYIRYVTTPALVQSVLITTPAACPAL